MAKSLAKVQSKVAKKTRHKNTIHENSRNAQRLRRAGAREQKLDKLAAAKWKQSQPLLQRVGFFQEAIRIADGPIDIQTVHNLIQRYLNRDNEELARLKSQRRPGRPSSTREDLLTQNMAMEDREYSSGFWMPDVRDATKAHCLKGWTGDWSYLNNITFIRVARDGSISQSRFPPRGEV